ncbi:neuromedin Bb [Dunckerocampus dactyliophorus]|uniref:neuromedin Bb n=1 Tax=Dunckerocampus dactyliophorus TaxID=161453 RepID=UPI0024052EAC|nr:neuromedin Bb [Dunckerocampus dactyliophorus]
MKGLTVSNACRCGLLTYLLFFSLTSFTSAVSFDLTELRNKVAKIKVNPRGNLWATGHFMGKKSVMDNPLLPAEGQGEGGVEVALPGGHGSLSELFQDFLRVAMQTQVDSQESRLKTQEADILMRILESSMQRK